MKHINLSQWTLVYITLILNFSRKNNGPPFSKSTGWILTQFLRGKITLRLTTKNLIFSIQKKAGPAFRLKDFLPFDPRT